MKLKMSTEMHWLEEPMAGGAGSGRPPYGGDWLKDEHLEVKLRSA